jgi:hypothetical protein
MAERQFSPGVFPVNLANCFALGLLSLAAGCCDDSGSGTSGGGGAGGAPVVAECANDYFRWAVPAVRVNKELGCVEVSAEQVRFIEVCRPEDESKYYPGNFFYCMREISTGQEYWLNPILWLVEPIPTEWEFCELPIDLEMTERLVPPPCFAQCPDTEIGYEEPASTCTEAATRIVFACGGDSAWDENCCRRPACSGIPCPEGFECRDNTVWTPSSSCWVGIAPDADPATVDLDDPYAGCSCVGASNPPQKYCFPL